MKSIHLLIATLVAASAHGAEPSPASCPDQVASTGTYRNHSYGFTVTLPSGVEAHWNSARCVFDEQLKQCTCMQDHGRDMPLGPDASLVIFANYTDRTLASQAFAELAQFKGDTADFNFSVLELRPAKLGKLPAYHYVAFKQVDGVTRYQEAIVAHTPDDSVEYTIAIEAPESVYLGKRTLFQRLVASWRASPR